MREHSKTIQYFYEIAKIPRESGNEEAIANYLCEFAKKKHLEYHIDEYHNVCIKKKASNKKPIILQAHTDMVCEKELDYSFDFQKDSIEVLSDGKYLRANHTTLGADNGIGVAQILNLLDSDIEANIEAVFTVNEENTMVGAMNFDTSLLEGKAMICLDGFEADTIVIESARYNDLILKKQLSWGAPSKTNAYQITLKGLLSGHSGFDIDQNRGNAHILLSQFLEEIEDIELIDFVGGTKNNVIPAYSKVQFRSDIALEKLCELCRIFEAEKKKIFPTMVLEIEEYEERTNQVLTNLESKKILTMLSQFPNEVYFKDNGIPTTSSNLGVVNLQEGIMKIGMRSSREKENIQVLEQLKKYAIFDGWDFLVEGTQPGFETDKNAMLIQTLVDTYPGQKKVAVKPVHITVEVGFFKEKMKDLEIAIISPNIQNAHTIHECVEIASIELADEWLHQFLSKF